MSRGTAAETRAGPRPYLHAELVAGGQLRELRRVVVDVRHQDANGGGGVETGPTLVRHHHLQAVLAVLLPVQRHPVDDFTWTGTDETNVGDDANLGF